MRVGLLLPTFRTQVDDARATAERAYEAGLDGVFAYDHLWPMGSPERPALAPFPVLADVAVRVPSLVLGPLVARVGLVGNDHLVTQFRTLAAVAPQRVVAALGTGDKLSLAENRAYGVAEQSADERRAMVHDVALALRDEMPVWIGAGAPATNALAESLGVTLNVWNRDADDVPTTSTTWNWAGNPRDDLVTQLDALAAHGATWAVFAPTTDVAALGAWRARQEM